MSVRYIYNTDGYYVAFLNNQYLFSPDCEWLGFLHTGNQLYDPNGNFLGNLLEDDRIVRNTSEPLKAKLIKPLRPLRPLKPLKPLKRLRMPILPYPYKDIFLENRLTSDRASQLKLHLESRINGAFSGWTGNSNYQLLNGQIWAQSKYKYKYKYLFSPRVKIFKASFNKYLMEVEGDDELMEVTRKM